jgi:uncharacterized protein (DUF4213/DUF364 family)
MSSENKKSRAEMLPALLEKLPEGEIREVRIGLHWTAVVTDIQGTLRCGLCSTLSVPHNHENSARVPNAGEFESMAGRQLASLAGNQENPTLSSVGVAALNSLLPPPSERSWIGGNADEILTQHGRGKHVVIVGHFPFIPTLRENVGQLDVLELRPREDDLPAQLAPEVIPQADVVAITSMAFANNTLTDLLPLCSPEATVMLLGPSTPLSPMLYEYGIHFLSGSIVEAIDPVLKMISQGAHFRQVHRAGVRLITVAPTASGWSDE